MVEATLGLYSMVACLGLFVLSPGRWAGPSASCCGFTSGTSSLDCLFLARHTASSSQPYTEDQTHLPHEGNVAICGLYVQSGALRPWSNMQTSWTNTLSSVDIQTVFSLQIFLLSYVHAWVGLYVCNVCASRTFLKIQLCSCLLSKTAWRIILTCWERQLIFQTLARKLILRGKCLSGDL